MMALPSEKHMSAPDDMRYFPAFSCFEMYLLVRICIDICQLPFWIILGDEESFIIMITI